MELHGYPPTNGLLHPSQGPSQSGHSNHFATTQVFYNYNGYPAAPTMYVQPAGHGSAASIYSTQQKKQTRVSQACEQCRQRKQRCDRRKPCSFCEENNILCLYSENPATKTDKNMDKIMLKVEQFSQANEDLRQDLATRMNEFDDALGRMEQRRIKSSPVSPSEQFEPEDPTPQRKPELDDHTTAPHKLILLWPSLRPLLQEANVDVNDGYVMEAEDRGVPRLYGRGEGIEEQDGTPPGGPASPTRSEDSFSDAPSPPESIWGCGLPSYAYPGAESRSHPYTAGGLKPDGTLDLDQSTIINLWDSYVKHMHVMHPFLDKARTRGLINKFISRYCPNRHRMQSYNTFAVGDGESDRPIKRQRSNEPTGSQGVSADIVTKRFVETERSPSNAVIYLVLALGKICAHKESLPGPVQDRVLNANQVLAHQLSGNPGMHGSSPMSTKVKPSAGPPKLSPNHLHTPPGFPNDNPRMEYRSRRSSFDGSASSTQTAKNMDVIPGIAYYAKAAEILGDQGDGNDLIHAQMFLLAGLYKGQLARVKESMSWITMAGRVIQTLLDRYKLYSNNYWTAYGDVRRQHEKGQKLITDMRQNLIVLASWTCLQLESDIFAELRLPSSGIQNIENLLLMPHNLAEEETYEGLAPHEDRKGESYKNIILFYTAQMFLRKRLNQAHRQLYGPDCLNQPLAEVQAMLHGHEAILDGWRAMMPPDLKWADNDPPPAGILSARLRAKYWGARYVINRPFLDYALHIMPHVKDGRSVEEVALDVHRNPRVKAEIHLFKAIELMGEGEVWAACRRCIEAAMQSTVALDGVPDRLVVTNIHGTAHA